jgi:hypothetical protein
MRPLSCLTFSRSLRQLNGILEKKKPHFGFLDASRNVEGFRWFGGISLFPSVMDDARQRSCHMKER